MPLKTRKKKTDYISNWRKNHPEQVKVSNEKQRLYQARKRFDKYGITEDDYNNMFVFQNGKCAICGNHQSELKSPLHIDHNHKTGKVRGLLCAACNMGIGQLQDDIENLRCAILYLNKED